MARKCWASALGGCDSMSGEHVISHGVLRIAGGEVATAGIQRVPDGTKHPAKMRANILCSHHNSGLSSLDAEATRLAEFTQRISDPNFTGETTIDGAKLERWLLKTSVNSLVAGWSDEDKLYPGFQVVQSIFGLAPMPAGCGLYLVHKNTQHRIRPLDMSVHPLWGVLPTGKRLEGVFVGLNGFNFFGAFVPHVVDDFHERASPDAEYPSWTYFYRPNGTTVDRTGGSELRLRFDWSSLIVGDAA